MSHLQPSCRQPYISFPTLPHIYEAAPLPRVRKSPCLESFGLLALITSAKLLTQSFQTLKGYLPKARVLDYSRHLLVDSETCGSNILREAHRRHSRARTPHSQQTASRLIRLFQPHTKCFPAPTTRGVAEDEAMIIRGNAQIAL